MVEQLNSGDLLIIIMFLILVGSIFIGWSIWWYTTEITYKMNNDMALKGCKPIMIEGDTRIHGWECPP